MELFDALHAADSTLLYNDIGRESRQNMYFDGKS